MEGSKGVAGALAMLGVMLMPSHTYGDERDPGATGAHRRDQGAEVEIALLGGFGMGGSVDDNSLNRYGVGLGGRAGVTLKAPRLYFGGSFVRFLGNEDGSGKYYMATLDALIGYDFRLLREYLLLRPELGLGVMQAVAIQSDNAGYPLTPHVAPGLLVGLRLSPALAFAEIRGDLTPDGANAATCLFGAGVIF